MDNFRDSLKQQLLSAQSTATHLSNLHAADSQKAKLLIQQATDSKQQVEQENEFLMKQKIKLEGSSGVQVRQAFTQLNNKRMQVAREEKSRTDKLDGDLLQVRDHCEHQM